MEAFVRHPLELLAAVSLRPITSWQLPLLRILLRVRLLHEVLRILFIILSVCLRSIHQEFLQWGMYTLAAQSVAVQLTHLLYSGQSSGAYLCKQPQRNNFERIVCLIHSTDSRRSINGNLDDS